MVASNTSPLNYLVQIGAVDLLRELHGAIHVSRMVGAVFHMAALFEELRRQWPQNAHRTKGSILGRAFAEICPSVDSSGPPKKRRDVARPGSLGDPCCVARSDVKEGTPEITTSVPSCGLRNARAVRFRPGT